MGGLWQHQTEAVNFAHKRGAALWHMGMGTGKSRCAIELARRTDSTSVLVLCPKSVCDAWAQQYAQFDPRVTTCVLTKGTVAAKAKRAQEAVLKARCYGNPYVVVVNYESARNAPLRQWLLEHRFDLLVLDECHRIKSHQGATSKFCAKLSRTAKQVVGLTGTPMPHSPLDVYAQFRAIKPTLFGPSFYRFRNQYADLGGYAGKQVVGYKNLDRLRLEMSRFTFQADRSVLDLPEATHNQRKVALCKEARRIYDDLDRDFTAAVLDGEVNASNALVKLLRLQQTTSGLLPVEVNGRIEENVVSTSKQDALLDLLQDLPADEPVVVFGRFRGDLFNVHQAAKRSGRRSLELSGKRQELAEWQAGAAPILAVQIQSGGTGIDLTRARYCVYLSTGYSLGDYEQSLARVHRPGQDRTVHYYHMIAENSIDEKVYAALRSRKQVVESVLDGITSKGRPHGNRR